MTNIVGDRGQELLYTGMPITDVIKQDIHRYWRCTQFTSAPKTVYLIINFIKR